MWRQPIGGLLKVYFESYGCTLNKSESGLYVNKLLSEGNTLVRRPEEADISVIGTCVVIKSTEDRMTKRIGELSRESRVRVIGCISSVTGKVLEDENIEVLAPKDFRSFYTGQLDDIEIKEPSIFDGIPINQGCTGSCNYCISHVARGKLVSRPIGKIVSQIRMQLERGIREVRISSLDTAAYGKDIGTSLPDLVEAISSSEGDFMLRVGMMEPRNTLSVKDRLMESYSSGKVFKFMHLPVQSGDNRVLESMNREYSREDFEEIVSAFRNAYPDSMLSTDIIAGYHGDDEESFEKTVSLIEKTRPEIINITRFSPRPYTPDYNVKTPPSNDTKRWTKEYARIHEEITRDKFSKETGKVKTVLVNEKGKNGTVVGRDLAYRPVVIPGDFPVYSKVECEIVDSDRIYLVGKKI